MFTPQHAEESFISIQSVTPSNGDQGPNYVTPDLILGKALPENPKLRNNRLHLKWGSDSGSPHSRDRNDMLGGSVFSEDWAMKKF